MEFKVENLCGFLIRSKLMAPNDVQALRLRWQAEAKEKATSSTQFLKWIVVKNYVTEYQASLLSRGHIDDFFLGEYKVLERVGRGRMAGVYKSVHPSGQVVAIKVLPPSRAKNALTLARFERESRLAVKLKHPHVVRAFQLGQTKNVHYLVMEFLEGETLDDVLQRRKRLPPNEAVRLIHQALLGLQHIHEQGMVHRDLKPANLMLLPAPTRGANETTLKANLKILDIGLAREFYDENAPDASEQTELTGEGVLLGTPDYLAPEQARDPRNIDIRADIYSLGCTLYHLLTGQPPFPDRNILNQMVRHATETPKPLHEIVQSLPEGLSQIVEWMMAKQPEKRYPTPMRAAQALATYLIVVSESATVLQESPQMQKYLTWLETEEKQGAAELNVPNSSPRVANAAVKPGSNLGTAAPKAKPAATATAKTLPSETRKSKRGTDSDVPKPTGAPAAEEAFDVELVTTTNVPAQSGGIGKRDLFMLGLGIAAMVIINGMCLIVWFVGQWLFSE